jgi:hypothetical protein
MSCVLIAVKLCAAAGDRIACIQLLWRGRMRMTRSYWSTLAPARCSCRLNNRIRLISLPTSLRLTLRISTTCLTCMICLMSDNRGQRTGHLFQLPSRTDLPSFLASLAMHLSLWRCWEERMWVEEPKVVNFDCVILRFKLSLTSYSILYRRK